LEDFLVQENNSSILFQFNLLRCKIMLSVESWSSLTFGKVNLGDERRRRRVVQLAACLARNPEKTLPQALGRWSRIKAAYRSLSSPRMTHDSLTRPHFEATRERCTRPGEYLLLADTTQLDFTTHRAVEGLGAVGTGEGRGLLVHTTLAMELTAPSEEDPGEGRLVGLWDQQVWRRDLEPHRGREKKAKRLERPRESQCWTQALRGQAAPPESVRWTLVGDRAADVYEVFCESRARGFEVVIRASQPRALQDKTQGRSVFDAVERAPVSGTLEVELRSRPGQAARQVQLTLRATTVELRPTWRPGQNKLEAMHLGVVEAREERPPKGVRALHWVLLTTLPIQGAAQVRGVVRRYARRWLVEEYHKALKSGTRIEDAQLSTADRIEALLGLLALVAVRLLDAKLLARAEPDRPAVAELCSEPVRRVLEAAFGPPRQGWTNREMIRAIARLGGFLARKHDGEPGWQTIWRGWFVLTQRVEGYLIARGEQTCG
jgi:hypothetical protein